MKNIISLRLEKLIDSIDYDLTFSEQVSIITAPNGCGKTTILNMMSFVLDPRDGKLNKFRDIPFDSFRCCLSDGSIIELKRPAGPESPAFTYAVYSSDGSTRGAVNYSEENYCAEREAARLLDDMGYRVPVTLLTPVPFIYEDCLSDDGTRYAWEDDRIPSDRQLRLFEELLNKKFFYTGKTVKAGPDGVSVYLKDRKIPIRAMSDGERRLFVLFYNLVFNARHGLALLDAPERGLHIEWQESFIEDILRICEMNDLQVILTTHSPNLVNGHWEFLVEREKIQ